MLGVRVSDDMETRLKNLSAMTGRSKSFYVKEALNKYLEDIEDRYIALYRLENPVERVSMEDAEKELGLED